MKKWDMIIIIVLLLICFIPEGVFYMTSRHNYIKLYAEIHVNGDLYKKIPLDRNNYENTFTIKTQLGTNVIQIKNKQIRISDADCADKICEKAGFISKAGETLVCLPHKLIVEIKGETTDKSEIDVLSY